MALNIKDPQADRLARELVAEIGETITTAVTVAICERLERVRGAVPHEQRLQERHRSRHSISAHSPRTDHVSVDSAPYVAHENTLVRAGASSVGF
jgi:antitoxin VapB